MTLQKTWEHVIAPTSHVSRLPGTPAPGNLTPYSGLHGTRHACVQSHRDTHTYTEVKIKSFSRPMYLNIVLKLIFDKNKTNKETTTKKTNPLQEIGSLGVQKGKSGDDKDNSAGDVSSTPAQGGWIIHQSLGLSGRDKIRLVFSKTHSRAKWTMEGMW